MRRSISNAVRRSISNAAGLTRYVSMGYGRPKYSETCRFLEIGERISWRVFGGIEVSSVSRNLYYEGSPKATPVRQMES